MNALAALAVGLRAGIREYETYTCTDITSYNKHDRSAQNRSLFRGFVMISCGAPWLRRVGPTMVFFCCLNT